MNPADRPLYVFLHIEKTAGSTLSKALRRALGNDAYGWYGYNELIRTLTSENLDPKVMVSGHIPMGIHRLTTRDVKYVTLLRHPIDRIESFYYYLLQRRRDPRHALASELNINQWVSHLLEREAPMVSNFHASRLVGFGEKVPNCPRLAKIILHNIRQRFTFVDLHDNVAELYQFLATELGFAMTDMPAEKVGSNKAPVSELSDDNRQQLEAANKIDFFLYEAIKELPVAKPS